MSIRKLGLLALSFAVAAIGASPAAAQSARAVERSGNIFQMAVCARGNPNGTARCHAHVVTNAQGIPMNGKVSRNAATPSGYGPADLQSAYKITGGGSGATIAIVDAYGYTNAESDLAVYRAQYGLPPCTTANGCFKKVDQNGGKNYPRMDVGWAQESALDLDMASAMCPNCKLVLVEATSATYGNLGTAVRTAAAIPGVTVISNSYGGSETGSASYESSYNQPGKAVTVSTGDSGYGVQFPASSPHVIAVGGTHLTRASNARGWAETAWSSGGSGCSGVYAKPSFQTDALCTKRVEADVSAVGDPNTGVAVYGPVNRNASSWMVFGGTSVSAPLIGGIYGNTGHTPTGAASIYANKSQLNDVTAGSNGTCGGTYFCTAGVGYDGPTGLGSPNGTGPF
jgi:subtilase family serine protease